jgi:glycerol-3-phosphate dehydrogenase (NAD(P)+)
MKRVGIVGDGARVALLIKLLETTGTQAEVWRPGEGDAKALEDVPLIFFCVEGAAARPAARALGDHLSGRHVVVHTLRELEGDVEATGHAILAEELPTRRIGYLTGPMRPEDITSGLAGAGLCASVFPEVHTLVAEALVSPCFRLYRGVDLVGAELAALYTRAIALVMGVASAMQQGSSLESVVFARGLAEAARFVARHGGQERTTFGMSGSGNLFADIAPPGSPDFKLGQALVQQAAGLASPPDALDARHGLASLTAALVASARARRIDVPILTAAAALLTGKLTSQQAAESLMNLPVLDE